MSEELRNLLAVASPLLLGLVSWFVRGIAADIKDTAKAVQTATTKLELHDARIIAMERVQTQQQIVLDDLRGFLARRGFRQRGTGDREEGSTP